MKDRLRGLAFSTVAILSVGPEISCSPPNIPSHVKTITPPTPTEAFTLKPDTPPVKEWPIWISNQGFGIKHPNWAIDEEVQERKLIITSPDLDINIQITSNKITGSIDEYIKRVSEELTKESNLSPDLIIRRKTSSFARFNEDNQTVETIFLFTRGKMVYEIFVSAKKDTPKGVIEDTINTMNFY